jgi:hypothetical protein
MNILIIVSLLVVFVILCLGLFTLFKGGDTARTWSNRLMRYRVLAQFVAIIVLMTALYFSRG